MSAFVHLGVHTEYAIEDSLIRIKPLMKAVREQGMAAVGVADPANMFATVRVIQAAMAEGVKPVIGSELTLATAEGEGALTLYVQNRAGYRRLTRLVSRGYLEGREHDDQRPLFAEDWLEAAGGEGLIALSGASDGLLGESYRRGGRRAMQRLAERLAERFPGRFYIEIRRVGAPGEEDYNAAAVALAEALELPVVATQAPRFLAREEFATHDIREAIARGVPVAQIRAEDTVTVTPHQYLATPEEMAERFDDIPEALENTLGIAERCSLDLELGENHLPSFPTGTQESEAEYLERTAREGLGERLGELHPEGLDAEARERYEARLAYELGVINDMGFPGYFLIVSDFIRWAKDQGIPVGPGRGSGAGSLVAFSLRITDLDPLRYGLLFERFLNPERVSMPDFDVDFCMDNRDRVIRYVARRYGEEAVSQIITFGTMAARAVIRDVCRALGRPYQFGDRLAKLVPDEVGISLAEAIERSSELRHLVDTDPDVAEVIGHARALEGITRQVGKHAGGVLIAPGSLTDFTPLYCDADGSGLVSQYDKDDVEKAGLVKFDFLGLRNLTIIKWALDAINARRAEAGEGALDILDIPLDDPEVFRMLAEQQTVAVFQLESPGMRNLIGRLEPESFEEIIALVALYRPGPLQSGMVDDFINRKKGLAEVSYPHPDLEPILRETHGVFLYQEQVMQCAQTLAGYSLGQADILRKAMGKKIPAEMEKQRSKFIEGAVGNGIERETATRIFELMEKFAAYGFNKSHSAAYALIAYQTAWLKAHHPAAYMAAVLSSEVTHIDRLVGFVDETRGMGLTVEPPSINHSGAHFHAEDAQRIRYGLEAIKGVGAKTVGRILAEREARGPFADLLDLCRRCLPNRTELRALIGAGALDEFGPGRATLLADFERAQGIAREERKRARADDSHPELGGLEGGSAAPGFRHSEGVEPLGEAERLELERAALGLFLSGHPFDPYRDELGALVDGRLGELVAGENAEDRGSRLVRLAGYTVDAKVWTNKSGHRAVLTLDDGSARREVRVFNRLYAETAHRLAPNRVLVIDAEVRYNRRYQREEVIARDVHDLDSARARFAQALVVDADADSLGPESIATLKSILLDHDRGNTVIRVDYRRDGQVLPIALGSDYRTRVDESLLRDLRDLFGRGRVHVDYAANPLESVPRSQEQVAAERERRREAGEDSRAERHRRMQAALEAAESALAP